MKANQTGRAIEDAIAGAMRAFGMVFDRQVVIGRSLYDTKLCVDFVVHDLIDYPEGLILESKWQDVAGSADEKFHYLVANIHQRYERPTIIVVHGGGCRRGAYRWLLEQCDGERLIAVFTLEEFFSWALRVPKLSPQAKPLLSQDPVFLS